MFSVKVGLEKQSFRDVVLKIHFEKALWNSRDNTCVEVSFLIFLNKYFLIYYLRIFYTVSEQKHFSFRGSWIKSSSFRFASLFRECNWTETSNKMQLFSVDCAISIIRWIYVKGYWTFILPGLSWEGTVLAQFRTLEKMTSLKPAT